MLRWDRAVGPTGTGMSRDTGQRTILCSPVREVRVAGREWRGPGWKGKLFWTIVSLGLRTREI